MAEESQKQPGSMITEGRPHQPLDRLPLVIFPTGENIYVTLLNWVLFRFS